MSEPNVQATLRRASEAPDRETLWAVLEPVRSRLGTDRQVAGAWLEALRISPTRPTLVEEAEVVLEAWPEDPMLVGKATDALIRAAERRPIDEPPLTEGPASVAAAAATRCLAKLSPDAKDDPEIGGRLLALRGNALSLLG